MRFQATIATALMITTVGAGRPRADRAEPTLDVVLGRAAAYVAEFQRVLSGIVAEEEYEQTARSQPALALPTHIALRSDLLLVKPVGAREWVQFRDVFEVNGEPVRDRQERLSHLFLEPSDAGLSQMMRILNESARFNIGSIVRNVNTPLFVLQFLGADEQRRFRFKRSNDAVPAAARGGADAPGVFHASTEVWTIEYRETERPTVIRTTTNKDVPARGRFWIEPATGRVLMAELVTDRDVRATIDVSFKSEPVLDMLVPVEMREHYEGRRDKSVIDATATYGRFRQFQVNVDQTFLIKK